MRLDLGASLAFGLSRRAAREAVRSGRIDVDGTTRDEPGAELGEGAALTFHPERPTRRRVRTRLAVLYEDPDLVVVDKPAGLLTVPTAEKEKDTLLARVSLYLQHRYRRRPYVGVVHRLDRDTSGAVVFARSRVALRFLQERFRRHEIDREYVALVEGSPPASGTFDAALTGDGVLRRRSVARPGERGRSARTRYRVLENLGGASLVSVELETGRTHQVRIHFSAAGHPLLGDRVYREVGDTAPAAPRQMLHARRLGVPHPRQEESVRVESPLPADFLATLAALRKRAPRAGAPAEERPLKRRAPRNPGRSKVDR